MNQYDWQDTAPAGPRERRSSNILRLLTWFWTASASQISMRARSFEGMLGCETNAFPAKNTCFSGDRGSVVDSAIYNTSSAQSQSCSEGTSAQQAAKRVPSQIQTAKSGVVLPICRHNSTMKIVKIDYVLNDYCNPPALPKFDENRNGFFARGNKLQRQARKPDVSALLI